MRGAVLLCMFVLCSVHFETVSGTLNEFFQNFGDKISDAWHYTWNNIVDNIKKPVKIKRLGRLGKLKTTEPPTTIISSSGFDGKYERKFGVDTKSGDRDYLINKKYEQVTEKKDDLLEKEMMGMQTLETETRNARLTKLMIPHLKPPKWTNIEDWRKLHKPIYGNIYNDHVEGNDLDLPMNIELNLPRTTSLKNSELDADKVPVLNYRTTHEKSNENYNVVELALQRIQRSNLSTSNVTSPRTFIQIKPLNSDYLDEQEMGHQRIQRSNLSSVNATSPRIFVQIKPFPSEYFDEQEKVSRDTTVQPIVVTVTTKLTAKKEMVPRDTTEQPIVKVVTSLTTKKEKHKAKRAEDLEEPTGRTFVRIEPRNSDENDEYEQTNARCEFLKLSLPSTTTERYLKYRFNWNNFKIKFVYSWFVNDI
ncbi:uncharacterized protein LOC128673791 isoform X2 [Plodia interpunctella]|uniref:uncharacterized protein LOC128673791 isoform X2 n=1 Tax=Plodia interpunctella TaxID=58824 RepID=UPI002368B4F7|nr:uncharacterized protein LOC128673791 isoform X2 [Plodia interpunctella]